MVSTCVFTCAKKEKALTPSLSADFKFSVFIFLKLSRLSFLLCSLLFLAESLHFLLPFVCSRNIKIFPADRERPCNLLLHRCHYTALCPFAGQTVQYLRNAIVNLMGSAGVFPILGNKSIHRIRTVFSGNSELIHNALHTVDGILDWNVQEPDQVSRRQLIFSVQQL